MIACEYVCVCVCVCECVVFDAEVSLFSRIYIYVWFQLTVLI